MRRSVMWACVGLLACAFVLVCGCDGAQPGPVKLEQMDVDVLVDALREEGLEVSGPHSDTLEQGDRCLLMGSPEPLYLSLSSTDRIQLYRFESPAAASESVAAANVSWVGRPHCFRYGRLIALYVSGTIGDPMALSELDDTVLRVLEEQMGEPVTDLY